MKTIKTDKTNKINKQSPDLRQEVLEKFKKLYPPLFDNEGMLNQDELEQLVSDFSTPQTEKYEFNWAGKQQSKKKAFTSSRATLRSDKKRSVDFDKTKNLIIEGDNLEVLKLLQKSYFGKIKCIYIDPPYNTGNDFIYSDDYSEDKQAYWEKSGVKQNGVKLDTNTDSSGRYHSNWLSMMYPRLLLAHNLLKEDGVIFVSIDDNEVHNLRKLMDEVFGEENFVSQFAWQSRLSKQNDTDISKNHEYIISYARNRRIENRRLKESNIDVWYKSEGFASYPLPLDKTHFSNPDNDPRGLWKADPFDAPATRKNLTYKITNPNTGEVFLPPEGRHWRVEEKTFKKLFEDKRIVFGKTGDSRPQLKVFYEEKKMFGEVESSWFDGKTHGTVTKGTKELMGLFDGKKLFDFPKPTSLIDSLLRISTKENDIVLDFFAGSGTTAHAVMDLNKEDGGNRKFILVQIPEATDEKSEAYKAGYKTISDICIERAKRAGKKLTESSKQQKLIDEAKNLDVGFKVFKLASSHFPENTFAPDPDKSDEENKKALEDYINKATSQKGLFRDGVIDLVYEIALKDGFELTLTMDKVKGFDKNTVYRVSDSGRVAFICVDDSLEDATIKQLESHKDQRFICLHTSVNTTKKWNLQNVLGSNLWLV